MKRRRLPMLAYGLFLVVSEDTYLPVEEEDGKIMGAVMRSRQLVSVWLLPRLRGKLLQERLELWHPFTFSIESID